MSKSPYSRYRRVDNVQSKYCYSDTDVYINKLNIMDGKKLLLLEADLTAHRLMQLMVTPVRGKFGVVHLKRIHKYIFQDLYEFAGEFREEDVTKGSTIFCKSQFINHNLDVLFEKLKEDKYLKGLDTETTIKKIAYYMAELNIIHPFREGNGRTIREFIRLLALKNGYEIEWHNVKSEALLKAMIRSANMDISDLEKCLRKVMDL